MPFSELRTTLSLSEDPDRNLLYTPPAAIGTLPHPLEISVVYWRTAYAPTDYYTEAEWSTRLLVERSNAVKCPSVGMQLAGAKKVQQVLAEPSVLDQFVKDEETRERLRESFTDLYPLDGSEAGVDALRRAYAESDRFVLKPQREGGGNNVYRSDIPAFLDRLEEEDRKRGLGAPSADPSSSSSSSLAEAAATPKGREGYILMSLIEPPSGRSQVLVKAGSSQGLRTPVVSELGIYGTVLLREREDGTQQGRGAEVLLNETVGHLLRTKPVESDEGGVATGFSVIDSVLLTGDEATRSS